MSLGGAGDVLVTASTSELVAGAGFGFEERGEHTLKGLDGAWRVRAVTKVDGEPRRAPADPGEAAERLAAIEPDTASRRRVTRWTVGVAVLVALALVAVVVPRIGSDDGPIAIPANTAARLDPTGERLEQTVPLEERPGASAIGFGSLWIAWPDRGRVARIDLDSATIVDTIGVGGTPSGIAIDDDAVWVTDAAGGRLHRIDPETNEPSQSFEAGTTPVAVSSGTGALWVADSVGTQLLRIDASTGEAVSIPLPGEPAGVAFTPEGVWVTIAPAEIARIDPTTETITLTQNVGNGPTAVTSAFDSIWVANHLDGTVSRVDPATGIEEAKVSVGEGPNALAASGGLLWAANELGDSIVAIDPATNAIARRTPTGSTSASLAADPDGLWIAAGASSAQHRGGTLHVEAPGVPTSLDPVFAEDQIISQILSITNDRLVTYKKVGGPSGATLVPDLATAMPQVTDDGLTYRFTLEEGVTFSTGAPLQGEDVRHSIERAVSLNGYAADLFDAIDGVSACSQRPARCDLEDAIAVDGAGVTISLTRRDPDLLYKLALPLASVVPSTTPVEEVASVPATGPYAIERIDALAVELVRNTEFDEWSAAAQPDGFVDRISVRWYGEDPEASFDRVLAGDADLLAGIPSPKDVETLLTQHPDQAVVNVLPWTLFVGLDVRKAPFDDPVVREALSLAVDRSQVADLFGGPRSVRITCQVLPPGFQGYALYCPHSLDPGSGVWTGPDLARASSLIADAGVAGTEVMVLSPVPPQVPGTDGVMRYVADLLNELGFRATVKTVGPEQYFPSVYDAPPGSAGHPHVFFNGWVSEYPLASDFIEPQFGCRGGSNIAGYCDRAIDRMIAGAKALEATDPGEANRAWTAIEHRLVDEAVQVPLANPVVTLPVSARTGNVQVHPQWGVLLSRLWVQ